MIDLARAGADVVLVGEALVTGRDPRSGVADLVAAERTRRCTSPRRGPPHGSGALHSKEPSRVKAVHRDLGAVAGLPSALCPMQRGHFDRFGGRFVPEALYAALLQLEQEFHAAMADPDFTAGAERRCSPITPGARARSREAETVQSSMRLPTTTGQTPVIVPEARGS